MHLIITPKVNGVKNVFIIIVKWNTKVGSQKMSNMQGWSWSTK